MPTQTSELLNALAKLSKPQIKSLMSLSDNLAELNHGRFKNFDAQPARIAIGAFEGMAYKGLDAPSLSKPQLQYLQTNLRILCGLYGVLRPFDEIRPYRLEMSTRLAVRDYGNLYAFWGDCLTQAINKESPSWVLHCASQEYAKAIQFKDVQAPVITACFPGPAVHAKNARGELTRFCCIEGVSEPSQLKAFRGEGDAWRFVPEASDESTYVFHRSAGGGGGAKKPSNAGGSKTKRGAPDEKGNDVAGGEAEATGPKSRRRKKA